MEPVPLSGDSGWVAKRQKLTGRQQLFVDAYLKNPEGKAAAIAAGYSRQRAEITASELLSGRKDGGRVAQAVAAAQAKAAEAAGVTAAEVLREMRRIALVDIGRAFDEDGWLIPFAKMPEDVRRALVGMEVDEIFQGGAEDRTCIGRVRKVKFADKKGALDSLMKHLGIAGAEKVELGQDTLRALVEAARKAAGK